MLDEFPDEDHRPALCSLDASPVMPHAGLEDMDGWLMLYTLSFCKARSLCGLRGVCRSIRDLIDGSAELRYTIALGRAGMVRGPNQSLPVQDQQSLVESYVRAWTRDDRFSALVPVADIPQGTPLFSHAEGVILLVIEDEVIVHRAPSPLRGIGPQKYSWRLPRCLPRQGFLSYVALVMLDVQAELAVFLVADPDPRRKGFWWVAPYSRYLRHRCPRSLFSARSRRAFRGFAGP